MASGGMAQTDGTVYELYKRAYQKGLYTKLNRYVTDKKFADALSLYEREKKWLDGYGPETLRSVAGAYRGLGLYASANKLMDLYGTEAAKHSTRSPSALVRSPQFRRDKATNSFARGAYEETLGFLEGNQDARGSYMRVMSLYRLGKKADSYAAAERVLTLVKTAKGELSDEEIENFADVLIERDETERDFPRMEREVAELRAICAKENERLLFAAADALWYQKRHKDAEKAYRAALEKFPSGIRSDRGRYNLGMSLLALGRRDEAVKLMTDLRNSGQSVWSESANQELQLIEWERKYSSVLRTLPPSGLGIAN
jgi:tetratricopeptide (TPR) repeat protein